MTCLLKKMSMAWARVDDEHLWTAIPWGADPAANVRCGTAEMVVDPRFADCKRCLTLYEAAAMEHVNKVIEALARAQKETK